MGERSLVFPLYLLHSFVSKCNAATSYGRLWWSIRQLSPHCITRAIAFMTTTSQSCRFSMVLSGFSPPISHGRSPVNVRLHQSCLKRLKISVFNHLALNRITSRQRCSWWRWFSKTTFSVSHHLICVSYRLQPVPIVMTVSFVLHDWLMRAHINPLNALYMNAFKIVDVLYIDCHLSWDNQDSFFRIASPKMSRYGLQWHL